MKKITFFTIMVVLLLSGAIYSCNGFEDFDFNESTALTDEAQALKELYQAEIPKLGELIETRAGSGLTEEEAETFLASFSTQTNCFHYIETIFKKNSSPRYKSYYNHNGICTMYV